MNTFRPLLILAALGALAAPLAPIAAQPVAEVRPSTQIEPARALLGQPDVTFIDLRDPRELWREGSMPGAVNVTRGMLEFWIDPESPYFREVFNEDREFVLY